MRGSKMRIVALVLVAASLTSSCAEPVTGTWGGADAIVSTDGTLHQPTFLVEFRGDGTWEQCGGLSYSAAGSWRVTGGGEYELSMDGDETGARRAIVRGNRMFIEEETWFRRGDGRADYGNRMFSDEETSLVRKDGASCG